MWSCEPRFAVASAEPIFASIFGSRDCSKCVVSRRCLASNRVQTDPVRDAELVEITRATRRRSTVFDSQSELSRRRPRVRVPSAPRLNAKILVGYASQDLRVFGAVRQNEAGSTAAAATDQGAREAMGPGIESRIAGQRCANTEISSYDDD